MYRGFTTQKALLFYPPVLANLCQLANERVGQSTAKSLASLCTLVHLGLHLDPGSSVPLMEPPHHPTDREMLEITHHRTCTPKVVHPLRFSNEVQVFASYCVKRGEGMY